MEMAGTHDLVDLNETKGNIEPCKGRNGIVIGEVRFTPGCYVSPKSRIKRYFATTCGQAVLAVGLCPSMP
jgi:hypothetical protein